MEELLLRPLADAFMGVGVFVALLMAPFACARHRWGHHLDAFLVRHRRWGPVVAAALTMPPGCGGAIIVMALYARRGVSYGAAVAALVATMGDASWVLLAADPLLTVQLKLVLFGAGVVTGVLVDVARLDPARSRPASSVTRSSAPGRPRAAAASRRPAPLVLPDRATTSWFGLGLLPALLWVALGTGATISVPASFQVLDADSAYLALGLAGTSVALAVFVSRGCRLADDSATPPASLSEVLRHSAYEIAFVTAWVAIAYVAYAVTTSITGLDASQLPLHGAVGVAVGALVGLVPGCGLQIVFCGMFLVGGMPLSTLVANSVSQDGDALIPLLALEQRSALVATAITTLPALVVGGIFLLLS